MATAFKATGRALVRFSMLIFVSCPMFAGRIDTGRVVEIGYVDTITGPNTVGASLGDVWGLKIDYQLVDWDGLSAVTATYSGASALVSGQQYPATGGCLGLPLNAPAPVTCVTGVELDLAWGSAWTRDFLSVTFRNGGLTNAFYVSGSILASWSAGAPSRWMDFNNGLSGPIVGAFVVPEPSGWVLAFSGTMFTLGYAKRARCKRRKTLAMRKLGATTPTLAL